MIDDTGNSNSQLTVVMTTKTNATIAAYYLRFRYLVHMYSSPAAPYLGIAHYAQDYSGSPVNLGPGGSVFASSISAPFAVDETDYVIHVLNGFDVFSTSALIGIQSSCYVSAGILKCSFSNQGSTNFGANYISIDVVILREQPMLASLGAFFEANIFSFSSSTTTISPNYNQTANPGLFFFGPTKIYTYSTNKFDFWIHYYNDYISLTFFVPQSMNAFYISFVDGGCDNDLYWNSSTRACSTCANGTIGLNNSCFTCGVLYHPNCTSCNSTNCDQCSPNFINNGTYCLTCGEVYHPSCTTCNDTQCTACSSPYIANLTTCFLC
jgi:hypothetical protein